MPDGGAGRGLTAPGAEPAQGGSGRVGAHAHRGGRARPGGVTSAVSRAPEGAPERGGAARLGVSQSGQGEAGAELRWEGASACGPRACTAA